jgi:hypothetical protein
MALDNRHIVTPTLLVGKREGLSEALLPKILHKSGAKAPDRNTKSVTKRPQALALSSYRSGASILHQADETNQTNFPNPPGASPSPLSSLCPVPSQEVGTGSMNIRRASPPIFMSPELFEGQGQRSALVGEQGAKPLALPELCPTPLLLKRTKRPGQENKRFKRGFVGGRRRIPTYVKKCGHETMILGWSSEDGPVRRLVRKRCKSWRCFRCRRRLSAKWFNKIKQIGSKVSLAVTLTFDPKKYSEDEAERMLGKSWGRLARRIRKVYGRDFEYLRVTEWHKSGMPHLHILCLGKDVPDPLIYGSIKDFHGFLKKEGPRFGFGVICYVQEVYSAPGAASYILADVTKTYQLRPDYRRGLRRLQASRKFFEGVEKFEPNKPDFVGFYNKSLDVLRVRLVDEGGRILKEYKAEDVQEDGSVLEGSEIVEAIGFDPPESWEYLFDEKLRETG